MKMALKLPHPLERLVDSLVEGELRLHQLPAELTADERAEVRRRALERMTGTSLSHLGEYSLNGERAASRHCENFLGVAQVPIGIIGPLHLDGTHVKPDESLYIPLATTEGALIASVNRGCSAIRHAGGATVHVEDVGITRAPVFKTSGLREAQEFVTWVEAHIEDIRRVAHATSQYIELLDIRPFTLGSTVYLRMRFHTGDAMGMNMVTIACDRILREVVVPGTGVECLALSGNYCVDKKPASINFHEGRGKRIRCEVKLSAEVLRDSLKTTAAELIEVQYRKNLLGSIAAGSMGFNAHYANILAAFFIATGQDVAQVVEGSIGVTCVESHGEDGVLFSVFLPDSPIGAVGGGTEMDTQRQCLDLLGVHPDPKRPGAAAERLAEILGGAVLAGELSLLAAITSGDLTSAHEKLARGK